MGCGCGNGQRPLSDEDAAEMDYTPVDAPLANYPPVWIPYPFNYRRAIAPEHNLVLRPPILWYRGDTNDRSYDAGDEGFEPTGPNVTKSTSDRSEDDQEFAYAEARAAITAMARFSNIEDWIYGGFFVPESGEHAPGRIWLGFPLGEISITVTAGADSEGPGENFATATLFAVAGLSAAVTPARIFVRWEYAADKYVTGEFLAALDTSEEGGSTVEITESPTIIISPAKWFTYGGKYNAETGELVGA